jgi:hypothetical protein
MEFVTRLVFRLPPFYQGPARGRGKAPAPQAAVVRQ